MVPCSASSTWFGGHDAPHLQKSILPLQLRKGQVGFHRGHVAVVRQTQQPPGKLDHWSTGSSCRWWRAIIDSRWNFGINHFSGFPGNVSREWRCYQIQCRWSQRNCWRTRCCPDCEGAATASAKKTLVEEAERPKSLNFSPPCPN